MHPTAEHVARAYIAGARETGLFDELKLNPEIIKINSKGGGLAGKVHNLRIYVALALRDAFPQYPSISIGRIVGAEYPENFMGSMIAGVRKGIFRWYDPEVLYRVVEALGSPIAIPDWTETASDQVEKIYIAADGPTEAQERPSDPPSPSKPRTFGSLPRGPGAGGRYGSGRSALFDGGHRRRAEEMLREAILNTGGSLISDDESPKTG